MKHSVCCLLLPSVLGSSRPASPGGAVVLAAGSAPLSASPDAQITPKVSRRAHCALLSLAEHTRHYLPWAQPSSLSPRLPLQLPDRAGGRRRPGLATFPREGRGTRPRFGEPLRLRAKPAPLLRGEERGCKNGAQTCVLFAIKSIEQTRSARGKR